MDQEDSEGKGEIIPLPFHKFSILQWIFTSFFLSEREMGMEAADGGEQIWWVPTPHLFLLSPVMVLLHHYLT